MKKDVRLQTNRLRTLRKKLGLSQEDVARQLAISDKTISNYERGRRQPDNDMLVKLAQFYGVSVSYLLGETENPKLLDNTIVILTDKDLKDMPPEVRETVLSIIDTIKKKHGNKATEVDVLRKKQIKRK